MYLITYVTEPVADARSADWKVPRSWLAYVTVFPHNTRATVAQTSGQVALKSYGTLRVTAAI